MQRSQAIVCCEMGFMIHPFNQQDVHVELKLGIDL